MKTRIRARAPLATRPSGTQVTARIPSVALRRGDYATLLVGYLAPARAIDLPAMGRLTTVLFPAFIALAPMRVASRQA
jgi:hypothetical protein